MRNNDLISNSVVCRSVRIFIIELDRHWTLIRHRLSYETISPSSRSIYLPNYMWLDVDNAPKSIAMVMSVHCSTKNNNHHHHYFKINIIRIYCHSLTTPHLFYRIENITKTLYLNKWESDEAPVLHDTFILFKSNLEFFLFVE
jgi:hypothetical protein